MKTSVHRLPLIMFGVLMMLVLCSCSQQPKVTTVEVTMEELSQQVETEDGVILLQVSAQYPVLTTDVESELIPEFNQLFQERAEQYIQGVLDTYVQEEVMQDIVQQYLLQSDYFLPYEFQFSAEVTNQQEGILSLIWSQYSFTGGAHGNTVFDGETYDLNSGEPLSLGDLLEMKDEEAYALVEQRYQGVLQTNPDDFFADASQFVSEHIRDIEYYLAPEGVTVFFQIYDVAPYAAGRIDIVIGE